MQRVELNAQKRETSTRGALSALRQAGDVPSVVYGGQMSSTTMSVKEKEFSHILKTHGANVILNLKLGRDVETVLVKEIQRDILRHNIIHVDFQRISLTEKIEVNVPVHVKGEAPGVKLSGGILEHILRDVRIRCLPTAIPAALDVDVSGLQLNQGLKVKDIPLPEGLEMLTDTDHIVVNIVSPTAFEEVVPAAAEAVAGPAEPEVIAKGKKPEEGEEGVAPAAGKEAAKAPAGKEGK